MMEAVNDRAEGPSFRIVRGNRVGIEQLFPREHDGDSESILLHWIS
jgi:hypothetical protein